MTISISVYSLYYPHSPRTVNALIDSGAEKNFILQNLIIEINMHAQRNSMDIHTIDKYTVSIYGRHIFRIIAVDSHGVSKNTDQTFLISDIKKYDFILGWPWLKNMKPDYRYK